MLLPAPAASACHNLADQVCWLRLKTAFANVFGTYPIPAYTAHQGLLLLQPWCLMPSGKAFFTKMQGIIFIQYSKEISNAMCKGREMIHDCPLSSQGSFWSWWIIPHSNWHEGLGSCSDGKSSPLTFLMIVMDVPPPPPWKNTALINILSPAMFSH